MKEHHLNRNILALKSLHFLTPLVKFSSYYISKKGIRLIHFQSSYRKILRILILCVLPAMGLNAQSEDDATDTFQASMQKMQETLRKHYEDNGVFSERSETQKTIRQSEDEKFSLSISSTITNTKVKILSSELILPEDTRIEILDFTLPEETDMDFYSIDTRISYFPLRFLQFSLTGGYISSKSETDAQLSGTVDFGQGLLTDPISINFNEDRNQNGYRIGLGTALYFPLIKMGESPIIFRAGSQLLYSDLGSTETEVFSASGTLIKSQYLFGREIILALGGLYTKIERNIDLSRSLRTGEAILRVEQELSDPWVLTGSMSIPFENDTSLLFNVSTNFQNTQSFTIQFSYSN